MRTDSFYALHEKVHGRSPNPRKRKSGSAVNIPVENEKNLIMALDFFSCHGVCANLAHDDVWEIADSVNSNDELKMKFPDHDKKIV